MKLSLSRSTLLAATVLAIGSSPVLAQQNFEQPFAVDASNSIGDVGVRAEYQGISPIEGSRQLLLTTINNAGGDLISGGAPGNQSGTNAVSTTSLNSFLGVPSGTIRNGTGPGSAAGTEGSAFKLTITLGVGQVLSFNYQFLTQEDETAPGYHRDFAFATLVSGGSVVNYTVLNTADASDTPITPPDPSPFFFAGDPKVFTFTATTAGTYTLGIGVADATSSDIASGLLVDNITVVPEPSTYALLGCGVLLLLGWKRKHSRARA